MGVKPIKSLSLADIPGVAEALSKAKARQQMARENSMLNLTHDICGFKIRTLTIRDYVVLDRLGCPFIARREPTLEDLSMFLWVMSPGFNRWLDRKWFSFFQPVAAFLHTCKVRRKFGRDIPATSEPAVIACFDYVNLMFYDSPPSMAGGQESCLSYLTGWFDAMQGEYRMTSEQVWAMPLPELFQRLNAIRQRRYPHVPSFNKGTDSVKIFILRGLRSKEFTLEDLSAGRVNFPDNVTLN